jgi:ubiquinone/menaquinone biosynthesis C-methylase UbiE
VEKPFQKDLGHLSWNQVHERQRQRAALIGDWMDALRLKAGDHVLEIGSGPGYVTFVLADRVGPTGVVYAVDRSVEAMAYLALLQKDRGATNIEKVVADAATLELADRHVNAALISMVLHHTVDPPGILRSVARLLAPGSLAIVAEFHPDGPCNSGPPREHRLAPHQVRAWCEAAGFAALNERRQTPEHYMELVQRRT